MRVAMLMLAALCAASAIGAAEPAPELAGWELVWADEFNVDGAPNPENWNYEHEGFLRNREEQWYTSSPDNIFVQNGMLHIVARLEKEPWPNPWFKEGADNWKFNRRKIEITSAGIISKGKAEFRYGRIVMRAKMPEGAGLWPAFWTIGTDPNHRKWPDCGEIDIVEYVGKNPSEQSWMQGAMHWKSPEGKYRQLNRKPATRKDLASGFHRYGIEWDENKIDFFMDDDFFFSVPLESCGNEKYNPFRIAHFLLLNLAVGGTMGGEVDRSRLPAAYLVDYVRVYRKSK